MHTVRAHYFIEGRLVASTDIPGPRPEAYDPPRQVGLRSHVYICSTCGKEWARIACEPTDAWEAHSRPCRMHRPKGVFDWAARPGVLTTVLELDPAVWDNARALKHLPLPVLVWEWKRELEYQGMT